MADVFISYASDDRNRVRPLAEALQARGFNVWWDRALGAGQDYTAVIERELRSARAVIVVWTASSAASTFVRDEAGRARDEGRLIPVMLDPVQIPLGFGSFQAEDFSRWNGGVDAPQMQILEEALKAKLEGRDIDGGAVARKRRKLMARVRIVSLLTVVALVVGIAAGLNNIFNPNEPEIVQPDLRAELLRLLEEGKLTPEQAIQLAQILEAGALGETQMAEAEAPSSEAPSAGAPVGDRAPSMGTMRAEAGAVVTEAEFDRAARETLRPAMVTLITSSSEEVRLAARDMAVPERRDAAMQTLWRIAGETEDAQLREAIYQVCGSVGEANNHPLAQNALERAATLAPNNVDNWRMLSRSYARTNRNAEAEAAALVSEGVVAQQQGQTQQAEEALQQALPNLPESAPRAAVAAELGEIAEQRNDWDAAAARFSEAYRLREQSVESAPARVQEAAEAVLQVDAQRMVRALDRSGRTREACERLRDVQNAHEISPEDQELAARCSAQFRVQVRPGIVRTVPREALQQRSLTPTSDPAPAQP